jgi:DNA-binding transcriptional LysR family regulator
MCLGVNCLNVRTHRWPRQKIESGEVRDHQQRHVNDRDRVRGAQLPRQRRQAAWDGVVVVEDEIGRAHDILEPVIASFCQAYPETELEIAASDEMVDLAAGGFDAGIRLCQFIAPDMVAVRLTPPFPFVVVGSPDYLARHGRPKRVDDLRHHACLRIRRSNGAIAPWRLVDGNKTIEAIVSGPLIAHDYPTLLGAAIQGLGLAQAPGPLTKAPIANGRLQALLTAFAVKTPGVFLYHPDRRQVLPKLRAFIEHVKSHSGGIAKSGRGLELNATA